METVRSFRTSLELTFWPTTVGTRMAIITKHGEDGASGLRDPLTVTTLNLVPGELKRRSPPRGVVAPEVTPKCSDGVQLDGSVNIVSEDFPSSFFSSPSVRFRRTEVIQYHTFPMGQVQEVEHKILELLKRIELGMELKFVPVIVQSVGV
jgi:hypothetical protein